MAKKHITKTQVKLYMKYRTQGLTQEASSAKLGFCIRSGRTIEKGKHQTQKSKKMRGYKTRLSPLDNVWESDLIPLLEKNNDLQPKTLFLYLERKYQDSSGNPLYKESILRTLQRRVSCWKAIHGKGKEIIFPQEHIPGVQGLSDFTHFDHAQIWISGKPFKHMFYHFRLVYSKWNYLKVISGGESFQALSEGLQEALYHLGGAPYEHRTDSLSAAFKNLNHEAKEDLTTQYEALCAYYGMKPTRNNKGKKHENGSVESSHGRLKNRIAQELMLRGDSHFETIEDYEKWIHMIVASHNAKHCKNFDIEQQNLKPLPENKTVDFEIKSVKVTGLSILIVKGMKYSVPSQFSGHTLTLHIYQHKILCYLGSTFIFRLERKYREQHQSHYVINYRHIIHALIKKPGAFRYCKYRNEILPNDVYRKIWKYIDETEPRDIAPKKMLRILKLAVDYDCEDKLSLYLIDLIKDKQNLNIEIIESQFNNSNPSLPVVEFQQHQLCAYDSLIYCHKNYFTGETYASS